jgi:hypothetical protein
MFRDDNAGTEQHLTVSLPMANFLSSVSIIVSLAAAFLGVRAATVKVRDNQDKFISDLQRQGRWAGCAAAAAAISTVIQAAQHFLSN